MKRKTAMTRLSLLLLVFVALSSGGCSTTKAPEVTSAEVQAERERLSAKADEYYRAQRGRVERVGKRLLEQIPNPPNVSFLVQEGNPTINAGATFGTVVVTWGMLEFVKSDDELATVLGHELGHHTQGHIVKGVATSIATMAVAIAAGIASGSSQAGNAAGALSQSLANHYNQSQELEADTVGLRYAALAGYNPAAAIDLFERLAVGVPQTLIAEFSSSHPSSPERMLTARKVIDSLIASGVYKPNAQTVPATSSPLPARHDGEAEESSDSSMPARPIRRVKQQFGDKNDSPTETKLRALYHEFRAGRISEEEYETRKQSVLRGE
jgi:Zn-dependent protease with chaperone function